jgi:uridine kinase
MYNFITTNKINYNIININYKLILSKCNIIAISGDSGSGKSSLMEYLINLYDMNVLKLETDRYHKWERNNINYNSITHLNPYANHLEMMENDVFNLKIGNEIYQVDYNHDTGKFTDKNKIESSNNIILCGLHTLYMDSLNSIIDIKIYMDTNRDLIKKWKIQRDTNKRGYSIDKINKQIESRKNDYYEYIYSQKTNADIIVNLYEIVNELKCNLIIQNQHIFNKLSIYFIKYNYKISIENNCFIIELKNDYNYIASKEKINYEIQNISIENNYYYNEILILLILYMK